MKSYVALGDSFTAGTGCAPGEGWADRLASALADDPDFAYENLAEDGATSADVRAQVGRAAAARARAGHRRLRNERSALRPARPPAYSRNFSAILGSLKSALPTVRIVTATAPEQWDFLPPSGRGPGPGSRPASSA